MASLHAGTGDVQVVDMRNDGAMPGLPDDAVVETTAVVDASGAHPLPQRELPPEMLGLVQHAKAYERLAVKAACSGSRDDVVRALLANPLVGQYPLAADLADELLAANRQPPAPLLPVVSRGPGATRVAARAGVALERCAGKTGRRRVTPVP